MLILQIAAGIWLGVVLVLGTFVGLTELRDHIQRNWRYGRRWYAGLFTRG